VSGEIPFMPETHQTACKILPGLLNFNYESGLIYECYWQPSTESFIPFRARPDKKYPNAIQVALDNFHAILNPVTTNILSGQEYIPSSDSGQVNRKESYIINPTNLVATALNKPESDADEAEFTVCDIIPQISTVEAATSAIPLEKEEDPSPLLADDDHNNNPQESSQSINIRPEESDNISEVLLAVASLVEEGKNLPDSSRESSTDDPMGEIITESMECDGRPETSRCQKPDLLGIPMKSWRLCTLRDACLERNLEKKGKKGELIERLRNWELTHV